jgi:hypothetical protein
MRIRTRIVAPLVVAGALAFAAPAANADAATTPQTPWQEGAAAAIGGWQAGAAAAAGGLQAGAAATLAGWQAGAAALQGVFGPV